MHDALPTSRRDLIAGRLAAGQPVVAAALAAEFAVSEDAIRRDLRALGSEGQCRRVYGGALPVSPASTPMADRIGEEPERKRALARRAAALVQPRETIFLDSGSTNLALAAVLPEDRGLTVVTNAVPIAAALLTRPGLRLVVVGGAVNPHIGGSVDAAAVLEVQRLALDRCFLGACAISAKQGACAFDHADAAFKRVLLSVSRHTSVMATTEKLETRAPYRVAQLPEIDHLVVEHDAPAALLAAMTEAGAAILTAEPPSS